MNNLELNQKLLAEAELIMEEVRSALERQAWNLVVRRAQEVVELSLKSLLKLMGIEYPKIHDVGDTFTRVCKEKKVDIEEEVLIKVRRIW